MSVSRIRIRIQFSKFWFVRSRSGRKWTGSATMHSMYILPKDITAWYILPYGIADLFYLLALMVGICYFMVLHVNFILCNGWYFTILHCGTFYVYFTLWHRWALNLQFRVRVRCSDAGSSPWHRAPFQHESIFKKNIEHLSNMKVFLKRT